MVHLVVLKMSKSNIRIQYYPKLSELCKCRENSARIITAFQLKTSHKSLLPRTVFQNVGFTLILFFFQGHFELPEKKEAKISIFVTQQRIYKILCNAVGIFFKSTAPFVVFLLGFCPTDPSVCQLLSCLHNKKNSRKF